MYSLLLVIVIAISCVLGGFSGGWMAKGWKDGAKIAALESRSEIAEVNNQQCETDIADVRKGVAEMIDAATERAKKAEAAMLHAQTKAAKHVTAAKAIREAPVRQGESECEAVIREQREYVENRRS